MNIRFILTLEIIHNNKKLNVGEYYLTSKLLHFLKREKYRERENVEIVDL